MLVIYYWSHFTSVALALRYENQIFVGSPFWHAKVIDAVTAGPTSLRKKNLSLFFYDYFIFIF